MALKKIPFYKFTSCGNNFVIVDESQRQYLTENEKSKFSSQATNINFGVGADGVIFLQPCRPAIFEKINAIRGYWKNLTTRPDVDIMFRLFEPNGIESFSCGNGLMCVASYLNLRYSIPLQGILTQIPTPRPKAITVGTHPLQATSWANMGRPHRVPARIANLSSSERLYQGIDILDGIEITFRQHDLHPFSSANSLHLRGFLVYTGEPHLVIFVENGISIKLQNELMFGSSSQPNNLVAKSERRTAFGTWLIHHIGTYLNKHYRTIFPDGINIDFVKMPIENGVVEYRCFERGINKETLACGTGALAVAFVARNLDLIQTDNITVWPHRCRWHVPNASIFVEREKTGWIIKGHPTLLIKGDFYFNQKYLEAISVKKSKDRGAEGPILDRPQLDLPQKAEY